MDKNNTIRLTLISLALGMAGQVIWWILLYQILIKTNATEFMWFLYWVSVPVYIFTSYLSKQLVKVYDKWGKELFKD